MLKLIVALLLLIPNATHAKEALQVCTDKPITLKTCFTAEIARTKPEILTGLMFRHQLPPKHGMLFIFKQEQPLSFWMKNTYIPLDIIWLNKAKQIIHITPNAPPCKQQPCPTYSSQRPAKYVLELNANEAQRWDLKKGDFLIWKH